MQTCLRLVTAMFGFGVAAGCGAETTVSCGTGTMLVDGKCVPAGDVATCGPGTHLDGTSCVPDATPDAAAPTIASIDPTHAGITGAVLFTITGTGFVAPNVTDLHVYFGPEDPGCEAEIGTVTTTEISGEVPPGCGVKVDVLVKTNVGSATTPFHYDALLAADGKSLDFSATGGAVGSLYVVDPDAGLSFEVGPLMDVDTAYGLTGLAFSSTGTLYGVTNGMSVPRKLVTVDPGTAAVTVIGDLVDAGATTNYFISDIKFDGTTLYGWGAPSTFATTGLLTINPTTGVVTAVGNAGGGYGGSMALDAAGTMYVSGNGAGADADIGTSGQLSVITKTDGTRTAGATLDYPVGAPINALAYVGTTLVGSMNMGEAGSELGNAAVRGSHLVSIDTTTGAVTPMFELPAQVGFESHIDALAMAPDTLTLARVAPSRWTALSPAVKPVKSAAVRACGRDVVSPGQRVQLASGTSVTGCDGTTLTLSGNYTLTTNRRGTSKLVDGSGRTVMRGVAAISRP